MANDFIFLVPDGGSFTDATGITTTKTRLPEPGLGYTYNSNNCGLGTAYGDSELKSCTDYTGKFTCDGNLKTKSNLIVDVNAYITGVSTFVGVTTNSSTIFANQISSGITTSLIYATSGTTSSTDGSTSQPQIDARVTEMHYHSASFSGDRSFQISYLTNGRSVRFYIRNTNSSTRSIGFQASTTNSFGGGSTVELSGGGGYSSTSFSINGTSGGNTATAMVWIANIGGNFVGVVQ